MVKVGRPLLPGWKPQVALVSTVNLSVGSDTITSTSTCSPLAGQVLISGKEQCAGPFSVPCRSSVRGRFLVACTLHLVARGR